MEKEPTKTKKDNVLEFRKKPETADSEKAKIFFDEGLAEEENKNLTKAAEKYKNALECDPNYAEAALNLGRVCNLLSKFSEAEKYFLRAKEIDPKNPNVFYNLGCLFADTNRKGGATAYYLVAIELDPLYSEAILNLAICFQEEGSYRLALQYYDKFFELNKDTSDVFHKEAVKAREEVIRHLENILKQEPNGKSE